MIKEKIGYPFAAGTKRKSGTHPRPQVLLQRQCGCGGSAGLAGECADCRNKEIKAKPLAAGASNLHSVPSIVNEALRSPGQPLGVDTRGFMESHFSDPSDVFPAPYLAFNKFDGVALSQAGDRYEKQADRMAEQVRGTGQRKADQRRTRGFDFSKVRVHAGELAEESARALDARAYTVGNHVVLGRGEYAPGTDLGRQLLAHELTHVVQQRGMSGTQAVLCQRQEAGSFAGRVPPRQLPKRRPRAPKMRPVEGEVIMGFPVTKAMCPCGPALELEIARNDKKIESFIACNRPDIKTATQLEVCARAKRRTTMRQMPQGQLAGSSMEQGTGRLRVRGNQTSACFPILRWGLQAWAAVMAARSAEVAGRMGAQFLAEHDRLERDPERIEKLHEKFPEETVEWSAQRQEVSNRRQDQIKGWTRAKQFWTGALAALGRICAPREPSAGRPEIKRPPFIPRPLYTPRLDFIPQHIRSGEDE